MEVCGLSKDLAKVSTADDFVRISTATESFFASSPTESELLLVLNEIAALLSSDSIQSLVWNWLMQVCEEVEGAKRELFGVSIFELLVEDETEPIWAERLVACLHNPNLNWVAVQAYGRAPSRLHADLEYWVNYIQPEVSD